MFTTAEIDYLAGQPIGRLGTLGPSGAPQVRPVGFRLSDDGIEIGGANLPATQKYRNIQRDGRVTFLVDDLASTDPWTPRGVEIRGRAEAAGDLIRVHPERIISWAWTARATPRVPGRSRRRTDSRPRQTPSGRA